MENLGANFNVTLPVKFLFTLQNANWIQVYFLFEHETVIEQEWHVRKSVVICATQLAVGLLLKKLKYLEGMLNIFEFSRLWQKVEFWLVNVNKLFWIAQPYFSTDIIQRS